MAEPRCAILNGKPMNNMTLEEAYAELLNSPEPDFLARVENCLGVLREEAVADRTIEAIATFNKILFPIHFNAISEDDALKLRCTAAIFAGLVAAEDVDVRDASGTLRKKTPWGFHALNQDAKGYCRFILLCDVPSRLSTEGQIHLYRAKHDIGRLLCLEFADPLDDEIHKPRIPEAKLDLADILGGVDY